MGADLTDHLIKNTPDVKKWFSSIDNDYVIQSLESFIADAETDYIIPAIGAETFEALCIGYNSQAGLSGKAAALLSYVQKTVAQFALMLNADSGAFRISDSGFYVTSTSTNKPVSDKKLYEYKRGRYFAAHKALEQSIQYLEANINDAAFAEYKASDQHQAAQRYFFTDSVDFTWYYTAINNSAVTFRAFLNAIDNAEREYIQPVLGSALFNKLKDHQVNGTLSSTEKALYPWIKRALANYAIAEGAPTLSIEFDGPNLVVNTMPTTGNFDSAVNQAIATPAQVSTLVTKASANGLKELRRLTQYLIDHASDYPDYTPPPADEQGDINLNDNCSKTFFV